LSNPGRRHQAKFGRADYDARLHGLLPSSRSPANGRFDDRMSGGRSWREASGSLVAAATGAKQGPRLPPWLRRYEATHTLADLAVPAGVRGPHAKAALLPQSQLGFVRPQNGRPFRLGDHQVPQSSRLDLVLTMSLLRKAAFAMI
jgi:hypothetical protein